jgi:hypothetical protein
MKISLKNSLAVVALSSMFIGNAMALDVVLLVPQALLGSSRPFENTARALYTAGDSMETTISQLISVVLIPFALLDESTNQISVNSSDLKDLAYSDAEISQYQNDLQKLSSASTDQKISSKEDLENLINSLDLGIVAKEQLRIK